MTPSTFNSGLYRVFALHDLINVTHTATRFLLGLLKDKGNFEFDHVKLSSIWPNLLNGVHFVFLRFLDFG